MVKQELKQGYKQTEIGIIPEDWEVKRVIEFTNATAGGTPSTSVSSYWGGNIKWMSSGELSNKRIYNVEKRITELGLANSSTHLISKLCILVGLAGQGKTRGTVAINFVELCTNQSIGAILPDKSYYSEYLFHNLDSRYAELRRLSTGDGGRGGLNTTLLRNLKIPLPKNLKEQIAIATILSDTDMLIKHLEKLITKKKNIKQGTMQQLLTGKKRLSGFSGEWEEKKLGEIGMVTGAGVDKKINSSEEWVRLLNYMDIYKRDYIYPNELHHKVTTVKRKLKTCSVQKGDLFLTPSSELRIDIGISAIAMENMEGVVYSYHIDRLRLTTEFDNLFSLYMLKTHSFLSQAETICEGSGKRYVISLGKFREMKVVFPKDTKEQAAIATILSDMDEDIKELEQKKDKYIMLKQGIMQELLTGRIRINVTN